MQEEHVAGVSGDYDYDDMGEDSEIIMGRGIKNKPGAKVKSVTQELEEPNRTSVILRIHPHIHPFLTSASCP